MRKILFTFSIIFLAIAFTISAQAGSLRVLSLGGIVPDNEYDTLYLNPAFLMNFDGLEIYNLDSFGIYGYTQTEDNYQYDTTWTSNIISKRVRKYSQPEMNPTIGMLGTLSSLGIGLLYSPGIYNNKTVTTTDSNANSPSQDTETTSINKSSTHTINALFGFNMDTLKIGALISVAPGSKTYDYTETTNAVEDPSARSKSETSSFGFGITAGALLDLDNMVLGFAGGYNADNSIDKNTSYYSVASNLYVGNDTTKGSTIKANLSLDKNLSDNKLLRITSVNSFANSTTTASYDKANYEKVNGIGSYAIVEKAKDETKVSSSSIALTGSLISQNDSLLTALGLGFSLTPSSTILTKDNDTSADPILQGIQYVDDTKKSTMNINFSYGLEGKPSDIVILRAGISANLFKLYSKKYTRTDAYDNVNSKVADTVTKEYSDSYSTILDSTTLSGGVGFTLAENLQLDFMSSINIFSLGLKTRTETGSTGNTKYSIVPTTKTTSYDFSLIGEITYKF